MGVSRAVALRGPAGLVPYSACRLVTAWLQIEVPSLPGLAVAWLERGTSACRGFWY